MKNKFNDEFFQEALVKFNQQVSSPAAQELISKDGNYIPFRVRYTVDSLTDKYKDIDFLVGDFWPGKEFVSPLDDNGQSVLSAHDLKMAAISGMDHAESYLWE